MAWSTDLTAPNMCSGHRPLMHEANMQRSTRCFARKCTFTQVSIMTNVGDTWERESVGRKYIKKAVFSSPNRNHRSLSSSFSSYLFYYYQHYHLSRLLTQVFLWHLHRYSYFVHRLITSPHRYTQCVSPTSLLLWAVLPALQAKSQTLTTGKFRSSNLGC